MKITRWPFSTNGWYMRLSSSRAYSVSQPITMRSGFMKSLTAAPSFRNSGLEATEKRDFEAALVEFALDFAAHLFAGAHRHGRLGDHHLRRASSCGRWCWPPSAHACRSALPSSLGGVPTAIISTSLSWIALSMLVVNSQAAGLVVGLDQAIQARFIDGHDALLEVGDLVLVDVHAHDLVAHLGRGRYRSPIPRSPCQQPRLSFILQNDPCISNGNPVTSAGDQGRKL